MDLMESNQAREDFVKRSKICDMMKNALNQLNNKLDASATQVAKVLLIKMGENFYDEQNIAFVRGLLRRATRFILTSISNGESIRDAFETVSGN